MNISFKVLDYLSDDSIKIRNTVFVIEQGFKEEFDDNDKHCLHVLMFDDKKAIGNARIIYSNEHNSYAVGRVAILKEYRSKNLGRKLMNYVEQEIVKRFGHISVGVSAQKRAIPFYEKVGYKTASDIYLEENYPHIYMIKKL